jgi:hypothetical protein
MLLLQYSPFNTAPKRARGRLDTLLDGLFGPAARRTG